MSGEHTTTAFDSADPLSAANVPLPLEVITFLDDVGYYAKNMNKLVGNFDLADCVIAVPLSETYMNIKGTVRKGRDGLFLLIPVVLSLMAVQSPFLMDQIKSGGSEANQLLDRSLQDGLTPRTLPLLRLDLSEFGESLKQMKDVSPLAMYYIAEYTLCGKMTVAMDDFDVCLDIHALACRLKMHGLVLTIESTLKNLQDKDVVQKLLNSSYVQGTKYAERQLEGCLQYVDFNVKDILDKANKLKCEALHLILCRDELRMSNEAYVYRVVRDWCMDQLSRQPLLYCPQTNEYFKVTSVDDEQKPVQLRKSSPVRNVPVEPISDASGLQIMIPSNWGESHMEAVGPYYLAHRAYSTPAPVFFHVPSTGSSEASTSPYRIQCIDPNATSVDKSQQLYIGAQSNELNEQQFEVFPVNSNDFEEQETYAKRKRRGRNVPLNQLLFIVSNGQFLRVRYPLIETSVLTSTVTEEGIVPNSLLVAAMSYQLGQEAANVPPFMKVPRACAFTFDQSLKLAGEWEFRKYGSQFRNLMSDESSITTKQPIIRQHNDKRVISFEVLFSDMEGVKKGFFGIGLMSKPLNRFKGGVTSKQNGTLYYSNGWISSFGSTLDKTGNVPPFDINDRVGLRIDLGKGILNFTLNSVPSGPEIPLNTAFLPVGAEMYPAVRLKSHTMVNIVS